MTFINTREINSMLDYDTLDIGMLDYDTLDIDMLDITTSPESLAEDKHSSLLRKSVNNGRKKFYSTGSRCHLRLSLMIVTNDFHLRLLICV